MKLDKEWIHYKMNPITTYTSSTEPTKEINNEPFRPLHHH